LFSAATILLSAWIPARRAAGFAHDAIHQSGEIEEGKLLNLKTSPLIRRVFGFEGELALNPFQRDRKRYLHHAALAHDEHHPVVPSRPEAVIPTPPPAWLSKR